MLLLGLGLKAWIASGNLINSVGESARGKDEVNRFHLSVSAEPDQIFVFQFGGEPESSSQVF
jgi:hypothetical protein